MTQPKGIPISEVLSGAKFLLGMTSNESDAYLMTLLSDGAKRCEISDSYTYFEVTLPVVNNVAVLPQGVLYLEWVRYTISTGAYIFPRYLRPSFVSINPNSANNQINTCTFYSEGDSLVFSPWNSVPVLSSVDVAYNGIAVDSNGVPTISESMGMAVKFYMAWQFVETRPDKFGNFAGRMAVNFEKQWGRNVTRARRDLPKFINVEDLGRVYNSVYFKQIGYSAPLL